VRVHVVVHEPYESPGSIEHWAADRGHAVSWSRLFQGEPLPASADGIDLLVVMGGPQSPDTTTAECPRFDSRAEQALLARCAAAGAAVVGVCLGAQLLGESLGARFGHSPEKEIGVFPVALTAEGLRDELVSPFGASLAAGHWHGDMPGLAEGAAVLARSEGCPRQIVRYGRLAYGFQCHLELTALSVQRMLEQAGPELAAGAGRRFVQPRTFSAFDYGAMNGKLSGFLDRLLLRRDAGLRRADA
jgi:GMP synthase (glutamine-hydrolysing)